MKFGVMLPHFRHVASTEAIKRVAQEAEAMGFDSLWITDRTIVFPGEDQHRFGATFYDPFATLAYAAAVTKKIMLGDSVIVVPYRNPFMLARMTATLDVLSNGRHIFGLGVSGGQPHTREEFRTIRASLEQRGPMTDEAIWVMKELWTSEKPSFQGKFWQFSDFYFEPKPVQKPHPPIWVGGNRKVGLRRTLEFGDAWHPSSIAIDKIAEGVKYLNGEAEKHRRNAKEIVIAPREAIKFLDNSPSDNEDAPLIGTLDQILRSMDKYREIGASHMVLDLFFGNDDLHGETLDSMLHTMEQIANELMPRFKEV